jgi:hypothetical protein
MSRAWDLPKVKITCEIAKELTPFQQNRLDRLIEQWEYRASVIACQTPEDIQTLVIPKFFPVSTNVIIESTRFQRKDLKNSDLAVIMAHAEQQGIRKIDPNNPVRRRVGCVFYFGEEGSRKRGRRFDADNTDKSLYDSLKRAGLIYEDGEKWCEQVKPKFVFQGLPELGCYGTVIEIEDVPNL